MDENWEEVNVDIVNGVDGVIEYKGERFNIDPRWPKDGKPYMAFISASTGEEKEIPPGTMVKRKKPVTMEASNGAKPKGLRRLIPGLRR